MTTDTSERGLERLICTALTGLPCNPSRDNTLTEIPPTQKQVNFEELGKTAVPYGGVGWMCSSPHDYDREYCIDLVYCPINKWYNRHDPITRRNIHATYRYPHCTQPG